MENTIFLRPAVAGILKKDFVECRLHVDVPGTLQPGQLEANRKVRTEFAAGNLTTPFYVIIDPKTGQRLAETGLSGGFANWESLFVDFLKSALGKKS
jgi:hypothetical protein